MKGFLVIVGLAAASFGYSQVIWDDTSLHSGTTIRGVGDEPALFITNSNASAVTLGSVAFLGQNAAAQNIEFFLADSNGNILQNVIASEAQTGADTLVGTSVNWTLAANTSYYIGAATSTVGDNYDYDTVFHTQNGLVGGNNGNFTGYGGTLVKSGGGFAEMSWQLQGTAAPEPASLAVLGLGAIGFLVRRRRK